MTPWRIHPRLGKALYGALFVAVVPALLVLWAGGAAKNVHARPVANLTVGLAVAAAGLALMLAGIAALALYGRGLPMNPYPPRRFVREGVYRVVAHPIYLGFVAACAGAAIAAGSASGLWLVCPVVALAVTALVLGHESIDLRRRFGGAVEAPWLRLPPRGDDSPTLRDVGSVILLVLLPWLVLYEAVIALGVPPDAVVAACAAERAWPVWEWSEALYASTYVAVLAAPFLARTRDDLRTFTIRGWAATGVATLLFVTVPVAAPPRPFQPAGPLGRLLSFERGLDSAAGAFPSFHVIWAILVAALLSSSRPRLRALWWVWAAAVSASCVTTGMHTVADVAAGVLVGAAVVRIDAAWEGVRRLAERVAGSWREWDFGRVRVINHGAWAGAGTFAGLAIVGALLGPGHAAAILAVAAVSLVSAALWAQFIEGSPRLLRPYGYYGGVLGVVLGALTAPLFGAATWELLAAFAVAGPWIQAAGRVRCLVQGCCHGSPAPEGVGIRYAHPRSRVTRLSELAGVPIHPTPLYSILWNAVIALCVARLWSVRAALPLIVGAYLILTGLGRFVEEAYRGEPQTPIVAGLRLYQWIAVATVVVGAGVTTLAGTPAPIPAPSWAVLVPAAAFGILTTAALGVDFPGSNRRFARLV